MPTPLAHLLPRLLDERGISKYRFAKDIGMQTPSLHAILAEKRPFPEGRIDKAVSVLKLKGEERQTFIDSAAMTHATELIAELVQRLEHEIRSRPSAN